MHGALRRRTKHVKPTRILAIAGIVILVVAMIWKYHQDSRARHQQLQQGHGTSVELPR
jgi:hypothetical protein